VLPDSASSILGPGIDGVLGQDFLAHFNYTLDFRRSRLVWADEAGHPAAVRLPLLPSEGRFLVPLPQDDSCRCQIRLVPDSGTDSIVLFEGAATRDLPIEAQPGALNLGSLTGGSAARAVTLKRLHVGRVTLRDQPAGVVRIDPAGPDRGDGLLPLHLFARVHFNNAEGYVSLDDGRGAADDEKHRGAFLPK
jgi:hypothetical protein